MLKALSDELYLQQVTEENRTCHLNVSMSGQEGSALLWALNQRGGRDNEITTTRATINAYRKAARRYRRAGNGI